MTRRLDYLAQAPELFRKFADFGLHAGKDVDTTIKHLVDLRVSQINGCGFCLDMHVKQAKMHGERELRLHHVAIWRESTLFSARERAAFEWAEALTAIHPHGVSDAIYESVRAEFSEQEITALTYAVMAINGWNRLNVAFRNPPGSMDRMMGLEKSGLQ